MKSIEFYTAITDSLGLGVEGDVIVAQIDEDNSEPMTCNNKVLVMPTRAVLKDTDWDKAVAFAPLGENLLRGESEVIRTLAEVVKTELNIRASGLLIELAKLAHDKKIHKKLDPDQGVLLEALPSPTDRFLKDLFTALSDKLDLKTPGTTLIDLNLRRLGQLNGKKYKRVCNITFPVTDAEKGDKILGVNWLVKDAAAFQSLLKFLFPDADVPGTYSAGTESSTAPYLVALLEAYHKVQAQINRIAKKFAPDFEQFKEFIKPLKFMDYMDDLAKLRDELPVLQGNEGIVPKDAPKEAPRLADPTPAPSVKRPTLNVAQAVREAPRPKAVAEDLPWDDQQGGQQQAQQTHQRPQREESEGGGGISYSELMRRNAQAAGNPQMYVQQPAYNQQPQRAMTIHDQMYGYNQPNRYQQRVVYDPGYDIGNSPYSDSYRPPHVVGGYPGAQQAPAHLQHNDRNGRGY